MGAALGGSVRTGVRVERTPLPPHDEQACDCEVTETAALHVPGRTIRQ